MKFTEFNFGNELQEGLDMMGFEKATPIQEKAIPIIPVSYTHLRAHETRHDLVCRLLLEKKKLPNV